MPPIRSTVVPMRSIGMYIATAGTVRIAAVPSAAVSLLPLAIANFRERRADVRLEISDVDSAAVRRRIQTDEADIGIISATPSIGHEDDVILTDSLGIVFAQDGAIAEALRDPDLRPGWELLALEPLIANPLCEMVNHPLVESQLSSCTPTGTQHNGTTVLCAERPGGNCPAVQCHHSWHDQRGFRATGKPTRSSCAAKDPA